MTSSQASSGNFTTDAALIVRSWDAWLEESTGILEADACGRALTDLFPDLEERGLLARFRRVAESGAVEVLASAFHHYLITCPPRAPSPHFTRMQQHARIAPLRAGDTIVGVEVSIEDVTPRLDQERELAGQLRSADDAIRLQAVRTLASMDTGGRTTGSLAGVLGDPSWRVRRAAADGLARADDDAAADALIHAVREQNRDPAVLNSALTALAHTRVDVVPRVSALLESPDSDVELRTYTALALGLLEDRRGVPALVRAMGDTDENVRFHAIEALGRIRSREAAEPLAAIAESREFAVAFAALDALAQIGEPSVARRIVPLLHDDMLETAAIDALGRLGSEDVVAPLAALLDGPRAAVVEIACALASIHDRFESGYGEGALIADIAASVLTQQAATVLIASLGTAAEKDVAALARVLGWIRHDGVGEALAGLMSVASARRHAADALVSRGSASVALLARALEGDDDETRKAAAAALGRIGSAASVSYLAPLLDEDSELAVVAAGALGSIGDAAAFEPLVAHLDHVHAAVRQAVVAALNSIGHADMPARVAQLLGDPSPRVRESAVKIAGYFGYAECAEQVMALCDDPDEAVRRAAVEQLPHLDDTRAAELLSGALTTGAPGVRAAAARALSHVPASAALPLLGHASADEDPWVRFYATRSLGNIGDASAVATLARLAIGDPVPPVRIVALEALASVGSADVLDPLRALASDGDGTIANAALAALGRLRLDEAIGPLLDALRSHDVERVRIALVALGDRGEPSASAPIAHVARESGDAQLREDAVRALSQIPTAEATDALLELAADPRRGASVVAALTRVGERDAAMLGRGLRHADAEVRCVVIEALARSRNASASPLLVAALDDPAPSVRLGAATALGRLDVRPAAPTSRAAAD